MSGFRYYFDENMRSTHQNHRQQIFYTERMDEQSSGRRLGLSTNPRSYISKETLNAIRRIHPLLGRL